MSRIEAWRPGDGRMPIPRFGLTPGQWKRILAIHARYQDNPYLDWPNGKPEPDVSPRVKFVKYLVETGVFSEGDRR